MFRDPVWLPPPPVPELALELEPQATENSGIAAITSPRKIRDVLEFIFVSCEDTVVSTRLNDHRWKSARRLPKNLAGI